MVYALAIVVWFLLSPAEETASAGEDIFGFLGKLEICGGRLGNYKIAKRCISAKSRNRQRFLLQL